MEASHNYAIDEGLRSFLDSRECSDQLREKVKEERISEEFSGREFHDFGLAAIVAGAFCGFLANVAANIVTDYFRKRQASKKDAKTIAKDAMETLINEVRLRYGEDAAKRIKISDSELKALAEHVLAACKNIRTNEDKK